jgi:VWFA-related protein
MLCASALLHAQEPQQPASTLSINVRVVAVDALVRDRGGDLVHHLTSDDFSLTEDGKPQTIHYFTEDEDLPLTIGLMVDTSGSQRTFFAEQQVASKTFLTNMLTRPQDNAFVVRFDNNILLLQRMTSDLTKLESALSKLTVLYPARPGPVAGTLLFDSLCGTAHNAFLDRFHDASQAAPVAPAGRRAVVILTDGEDNGSTKIRDEAIECAQNANITVYTALYTSREQFTDERDDPRVHVFPHEHLPGRTNMERISRATGGRVFVVSKKLPIEQIYAQIQEDLRRQYRIGYTPPPSEPGSYHLLELKPLDKRFKIQARVGYYTPQ